MDLDGTLYLGPHLFPDTLRFLRLLTLRNKARLFLTNNSFSSTTQYLEKLNRLGFEANESEIITSGWATIHFLLNETPYRNIYLLGSEGLTQEFLAAGLRVVNATPPYIDAEQAAEAIVLGFDRGYTYEKLKRAAHLLMEGIPYYSTHPDKVCPTEGLPIPDTGALIEFFAACTGRRPAVVGKPYQTMIRAALARTQTNPQETVMVGDRLYTDMRMAKEGGLRSILVLSGETKLHDVQHSELRPDITAEHIGELADLLESIEE